MRQQDFFTIGVPTPEQERIAKQTLREAVELAGGYAALGRLLASKDRPNGITGQAVWQWRMIPPYYALAIERIMSECAQGYLHAKSRSAKPDEREWFQNQADRCLLVTRELLRPDYYPPEPSIRPRRARGKESITS